MKKEQYIFRAKLLLWLMGVPIMLVLVGLYLYVRLPTEDQIASQLVQYQHRIEELDRVLEKTVGHKGAMDAKTAKKSALLALKQVQDKRYDLEYAAKRAYFKLNVPAAIFIMACGALVLVLVSLTLVRERQMASRVYESREHLLSAFMKSRKHLNIYLNVLVSVLLLAVFATMYSARSFVGGAYLQERFYWLVPCFIILYLMFDIGAMMGACRPMKAAPVTLKGMALTPEQASALWSLVKEVAGRIAAPVPDEIVVGMNESFFMSNQSVQLSSGIKLPKGRVLYLPLPYVAFMDRSELCAVIAHELGHFCGEEGPYSERLSTVDAFFSKLDTLKRRFWQSSSIFGTMFLGSFRGALLPWILKRELEADNLAAQAVSADALGAALVRIAFLEQYVDQAFEDIWCSSEEESLRDVCQVLASRAAATPPHDLMQCRQQHPLDTHPPLALRIKELGVPMSEQMRAKAMDCSGSNLLHQLSLDALGF